MAFGARSSAGPVLVLILMVVALYFLCVRPLFGPWVTWLGIALLYWLGVASLARLPLTLVAFNDGLIKAAFGIAMVAPLLRPPPTVGANLPVSEMKVGEREWPYLPRWRRILLGLIMFGAAALYFEHLARTNTRGLVIDRIIPLSPSGANGFYWALSAASLLLTGGTLLMAIARVRGVGKRKVIITPTYVAFPPTFWSDKLRAIDFDAVTALSVTGIRRRSLFPGQRRNPQRMLTIRQGERRSTILSSQLPSAASFDEIRSLITARVPAGAAVD